MSSDLLQDKSANPTAAATAAPKRRAVHHCFVCADNAYFGFTTASGTVWTCSPHQPEGLALRVNPAALRGQGRA